MFLSAAGCQSAGPVDPNVIDPAKIETRDDITQIVAFWQNVSWILDSDQGAIGIRVPVYFISAETQKGAFVPGTIHIWIDSIVRGESGHVGREFAHGWQLSNRDAFGFRNTKRAVIGYSYGFILRWPETLDLLGREVDVTIGYERNDGRLITSTPKRLRVPAPARRSYSTARPPPSQRESVTEASPPPTDRRVAPAQREKPTVVIDLRDRRAHPPPAPDTTLSNPSPATPP